MGRWAQPQGSRHQISLFAPTLDDSIAADHPVRFVDEVLEAIDFASWECHYDRTDGQPPIHPRVLASVILYGLSLGIRSSRQLEQALINRIDFLWLTHQRGIDHSTLCHFRNRFETELKNLFKQIGRLAIRMGMVNLNQIALDGTALRSNNSRYATARRTSLEQKLAALDQQVEEAMREASARDQQEQSLYGTETPAKLPRRLADLTKRQALLQRAVKKLQEQEARRQGRKDVSEKGPAVPVTDPDSTVLPNKQGGYAPNYTVVLGTEGQSGLIMDMQVLTDNNEASTVLPAIEHVQETFGQKPQEVLADSGFNSGPNLAGLSEQQVEALMPARQAAVMESPSPATEKASSATENASPATENASPATEHPSPAQSSADRAEASVGMPADPHGPLPMNPQNKVLDRSAFGYDPVRDCYVCPQGRRLDYVEKKPYARDRGKGTYRVYQCDSCEGCPLAARCLNKAQRAEHRPRRVVRDEYEGLREEMAQRLRSPEGKARYKRRSFLCETTFAVLRRVMNFGQLLRRGLANVKQEMMWACCAYNVRKIVAALAGGRVALPAAAN